MSVPDIQRSPMEQFREQVAEKLSADIGDLMPQSVLEEIVKKFLDDAFLKPAGPHGISQAQKAVIECLRPGVEIAAQKWAAQHGKEMLLLMKEAFERQMITATIQAIEGIGAMKAKATVAQLLDNMHNAGMINKFDYQFNDFVNG